MVVHQRASSTLDLEGFPPGFSGVRVHSHEPWRNRGEKRFGQVRTRCGQAKETYFPTGLFGCDLSLLYRHRPHRRQVLPGIHPRAQRSPGRGGGKGDFTSQGEEARKRASVAPGEHRAQIFQPRRCGLGQRGPRCAADRVQQGPQSQGARSCAAPSPPRAPLLRPLGTRRRHLGKSGLCTGRLAGRPPGPPIGSQPATSTAVGAGRGARQGASRREGGSEVGGAIGLGGAGEPAVHHKPRPPRPPPQRRGPSGMGPYVPRLWEAAIGQPAGRRVNRGRG